MKLFRSLTHRSFASLWIGQTISRVGDHLYEVALAWWVLQKTGSALQMGAVLIFSFAPMVLFLMIGGVAVDRYPRAKIMLISDLARGIVVAIIAGTAYAGTLQVWHVYIGSVIFGLADAFFAPAYAAAVPELVHRDVLASANSLTSLSVQAGRIAGPAIGAGLVKLGGTPLAFALNSVSFFLSAAFVLPLLKQPRAPCKAGAAPSFWRELRDGWALIMGLPWLWISIAVMALTNVTLAGPYAVALPFLVKDEMHRDVGTLGLLYSIFPMGYVLSAVWLGSMSGFRRAGWIIYLGVAVAGAMMLVIGLPVSIVLIGIAAFINGAALEAAMLTWTQLLQEKIKPEMLGRVSSIESLGSYALIPIGFGVVGFATDHIGARWVIILGGGITAMLALMALLHPAVRKL